MRSTSKAEPEGHTVRLMTDGNERNARTLGDITSGGSITMSVQTLDKSGALAIPPGCPRLTGTGLQRHVKYRESFL